MTIYIVAGESLGTPSIARDENKIQEIKASVAEAFDCSIDECDFDVIKLCNPRKNDFDESVTEWDGDDEDIHFTVGDGVDHPIAVVYFRDFNFFAA